MSTTKNEKRSTRQNPSAAKGTEQEGDVPKRVIGLIQKENYAAAYDAMRVLPRTPVLLHAMAVCALRMGKAADAVNLFRGMSVSAGTTILKPEVDDTLKVNYATALMLVGLPSGGLDILHELKDAEHPGAERIRSAIGQWANGLSFWRRWDWKLNRIDPPRCSVPIDFTPGIFPFPVGDMVTARDLQSDPTRSGSVSPGSISPGSTPRVAA
ncbi:hypothetical protein FHS27_001596 [Rhodopirellula rubra]|uniref:Uncharacterized protein n=1 Tax=Aporhodopirellula rubra TaxID=980271 RepID=A0A7W5H3Z1_9BACT|nr:hypothetical protein [Aporhodopirellula rubra]MBB3205792.1 hypothetical protein [Aporhodopirellula rubra]